MRFCALALIACLLIPNSAPAQEDENGPSDDQIIEMLEIISDLEARMSALEEENSLLRTAVEDLERLVVEMRSPHGVRGPDMTAAVEGRPAFLVEEVRRYDAALERARIAEIDKEIAALEKDVAEATKKVSADRTRRRGTRGLGSAEVSRLSAVAASGKREIYKLKVEAARINRDIQVPRFWIMGWDGEQDIMLLTTREEAELMRVLRQGDIVQWIGEIVDYALLNEGMSSYQTVVSSRVWRVEAGITVDERPKDRKAVWTPLLNPQSGAKSTTLPHIPSLPKR